MLSAMLTTPAGGSQWRKKAASRSGPFAARVRPLQVMNDRAKWRGRRCRSWSDQDAAVGKPSATRNRVREAGFVRRGSRRPKDVEGRLIEADAERRPTDRSSLTSCACRVPS